MRKADFTKEYYIWYFFDLLSDLQSELKSRNEDPLLYGGEFDVFEFLIDKRLRYGDLLAGDIAEILSLNTFPCTNDRYNACSDCPSLRSYCYNDLYIFSHIVARDPEKCPDFFFEDTTNFFKSELYEKYFMMEGSDEMLVVGIEKVSYTKKDGNQASGLKLHVTEPVDNKNFEGERTDQVYIPSTRFEDLPVLENLEVGDLIEVFYNRFGGVKDIKIIKEE